MVRQIIHRQFENKEHEKRFMNAMINDGYSEEKVVQTIKLINQKKFFSMPREKLK